MFESVASERHQKFVELKQAEVEQQMLLEREERIRQIESDIIDVNQIMKELGSMVHEQGETISRFTNSQKWKQFKAKCVPDSIENNIERAYSHADEGRQQLEKAASHQVRITKVKLQQCITSCLSRIPTGSGFAFWLDFFARLH